MLLTLSLQSLENLSLGVYTVPPEIAKFTKLVSLSLTENGLTDLPDEMGITHYKCLHLFYLSFTPLTETMTSLEILILAGNGGLDKIPRCVSRMTNLVHLNMNNCGLSNLDGIEGLTNLRGLSIKNNRFEVLDVGFLDVLPHLEFFLFSDNELLTNEQEILEKMVLLPLLFIL